MRPDKETRLGDWLVTGAGSYQSHQIIAQGAASSDEAEGDISLNSHILELWRVIGVHG